MAAAQYRQLPPDVHKKRQGIIKEADSIKARMAAAPEEDKHLHHAALAELSGRHERLLAPYKISTPDAQQTIASGGTVTPGKARPINLNTAAADADEAERATKSSKGGVKALSMEDIKAADSDKAWHSMSAEDQAAAAKGAKPSATPAGAAHTTSTPGSTHQTAMAAALARAGVSAPAEKPAQASPVAAKKTTVSPDVATAARNNMATPRGDNDTSVVSGLTGGSSQTERDNARAAATKGTRGSGNKAADSAAARASQRRSAASSAPLKGPQFGRVGDDGHEASSAPGRDWVTPSQISAKAPPAPAAPVSNPAPHAPVPTANATPAAPSAPTTPPGKLEHVIGSRPEKGVSPAHMVSSAPGRDWLNPQRTNKSKKAAAPKEAVSEEPTLAPSPAPESKKATVGGGRSAPSSAAAVGNVNRSAMPSDNDYSGAVSRVGSQQNTPMAGPQMERAHAAEASGFNTPAPQPSSAGRTRTPTAGPAGPVGGGRSGTPHQGGERNINVGGDNNGTVTQNHNTYNINYGHVGGSQGNVDHGYSPRGPQQRGGGSGGGGAGGHDEGHGGGFNAWYKDSTGHHDLRKGLDHVTGRTGGSGERLDKPEKNVGSGQSNGNVGGSQRPLKGSSRAAGGASQTQPVQSSTGTTHNWQGPQPGKVQSASGNGTAQQNPTP